MDDALYKGLIEGLLREQAEHYDGLAEAAPVPAGIAKEFYTLKANLARAALSRFQEDCKRRDRGYQIVDTILAERHGVREQPPEPPPRCPLEGTAPQFCEDLECPVHGSRNRAWRLAKYPPRCPGCKLQMVETVSGGWGCPTLGTPGCMKDTGPTGHWTVEQILRREA